MISSSKLPAGWQIKSIGSFSKVTTGATPLRAKHDRYFTGGNIPWIKTTDLNNSDIVDCEEKITELAVKENSCSVLPENTVLVAMYGGFRQIGRTGILRMPAATNQALSAIRVNEKEVTPYFLLHYLNENVDQWKRLAASSRKDPNITRQDVLDYEVVLPPVFQQEKIVTIAATWDDAISLQSRQLQQLHRRKSVLSSDLLTGSIRLPGFIDEWQIGALGDYFSERVERGDLELPLLAITANQGIVHRDTLEKRDTSNEDKSKYKRIRVGDIGYNTMRMWQGVSSLSAFDGIVSPAYTILKPLANCDAEFMAHLFKWPPMIHAFKRHSQGLVDDTLLCKYDSFKRVPVKAPGVTEQRAIAEVLNTAAAEIRLNERKLNALREQKSGLLQKLLNGEILLS